MSDTLLQQATPASSTSRAVGIAYDDTGVMVSLSWRGEFWTTYWEALFPSRKPDDHEFYKAKPAANLREPRRTPALLAMLGLSKAETAAMLPNSRVPALVIMGSRDPDFDDPASEARWIRIRSAANLC